MNWLSVEIFRAATTPDGDLRGALMQVYKPASGDASNGGASHKFDKVFVICPSEHQFASQYAGKVPMFIVEERVPGYRNLVECDLGGNQVRKSGCAGPMAGGCFVYSCDSRFRTELNAYPLALHDRWELWEPGKGVPEVENAVTGQETPGNGTGGEYVS